MDSSPRPQRRFSRWQTTKRTFVLAGLAYKPTESNTVLQDDNEKSGTGNKAKKDKSDKNDKSKNDINDSTADSVTKQSHNYSPLVAKSSVARRLCLDTSRRKDSKTNTVSSNETTPTAAVDAVLSDSCPRKEDGVPWRTSSDSTETSGKHVKVDQPLVQDFRLQLERVDLEIYEESTHQNKYALSNISQNKSAETPSQTAAEDKSSAVQTLPSQKKANVAVNNVTEGVLEDDAIINVANKRKRQAADDDDKSSDSSSTDKENVEKDSANISVPSPSKKGKKDATLQNMPSATRNLTSKDFNISQKNKKVTSQAAASSARRSGLRNRSLLVSPETLLKNRQYPVLPVAEKKSISEKNESKMGSSVNRKTAKKTLLNELEPLKGKNSSREILNQTPLPVLELSKDMSFVNSGSSFGRRSNSKKGSSALEASVTNETSSENMRASLSKKDQSKKTSRIKAVVKHNSVLQKKQNEDSSVNSSRNDLQTPAGGARVHTGHSEDGSKRALRDRRLLPTPEEVQRQRMYPVEFLLPKRRSSGKSDNNSQQKRVQNRDSLSQLEQTEPSPAATKEKNKGQSLKNQNKSKKYSPSLQQTSFISHEISEPTRRSSGKSDNNSQQKRVQNRDSLSQLEQTEPSLAATKEIMKGKSLQNRNLAHESSKIQHKSKKCSPSPQHTSQSSQATSKQPTAQRGSLPEVSVEKPAGAEDLGLSAKTRTATCNAEKESINLSVHSVQSEDTGSFRAKSRLRDRSLLATAEEVQQRRLYPVEFLLPKRRSSVVPGSVSKQKAVQNRDSFSQVEETEPTPAATKEIKEKSLKNKNTVPDRKSSVQSDSVSKPKGVQNRDSVSQIEETETTPAATNEIIKEKSLKNKNTVHESSKGELKSKKSSSHKSKRCSSSSLQQTSSLAISEQSGPQKSSRCNTSVDRQIDAEDIGLRAKTKISPSYVEKEHSSLLVHSAHSEDTNSVTTKSRLADQSLLPTAGEVQQHQQPPTTLILSSRSSVKQSDSDSRHDVSVKKQQKEVQNREVSSELEQTEMSSVFAKSISRGKSVSSKKERNVESSKRPAGTKKCSSSLQHSSLSSLKSPTQPVRQRETVVMQESVHRASVETSDGTENIKLTNKTKIKTSHAEKKTDSISAPDVHSKDADSFSSKRGLRVRTKLPTAEQMRQDRQYPVEFFFNSRRSFGISEGESKANASGKTQQKKIVLYRETYSQLEHTEHLSVPPEIDTETSSKSNKKERHPSSQSQPERKKCSSPLRSTSLGSSETFEQPSPQRESTHGVLNEKPVSVETVGDSASGRFSVECVEKGNTKHSTLKIMKKKGLGVAAHATMVQSTLNFRKTVSTAHGAPLLEPRQELANKTQKVSEKESVKEGIQENRTSILNKKPLSKMDKKQYSLPRRPVKKSSASSNFEQSGTSVVETDISVEPSQQSLTIVDTTWRRPQKLAIKKHPVQQKSNLNDRQPVGQKHADVNETPLVPQKVPRKRKLLEELDKAEGGSTQRINEVESQHVIVRLQDDGTRKSSSLSAVDVILQAVGDTEDKILAETEDDDLGHRLVKKVLGRLRKKMKPMISDVDEVNNLKHEIRQKNARIRKLSAKITEQQQLKSQLRKEIHNGPNLELVSVRETMKGYAQLMQALVNKSK